MRFSELNVLQGLCTILYGINLSQIHEIVLTLGHVSELSSDKRDFSDIVTSGDGAESKINS